MSENGKRTGPLVGVKVVELAGIGPAPLCCALLSDMGADVLRIDRNTDPGLGLGQPVKADIGRRGGCQVRDNGCPLAGILLIRKTGRYPCPSLHDHFHLCLRELRDVGRYQSDSFLAGK